MMVSTEFITLEEITSVMEEVIERFLIPRFNELGMNASGDWIKSVGPAAEPGKGIIMGLDYTKYLTKGREPGKRPPVSALEKWVKSKFGLSGRQAESMAWAVAKNIEKSGTTWYEKGGSDLLEVLEEQQTINWIMMKLGEKAIPRIQEELLRQMRG
ncbi:hypothetical protein [Chryseobacterium culicis]|uniref:hypothetical protein n=1 Tax=Chryseobacterium culicis TaxID=680127 RepID=UPI001874B58E|nr:hypothetical protein [Chryseobacterium culicis]MBE4949916.1 hypothetical protein [Chryseobacterium culicis]